ncbi:DUF397 domain-containing protein [Streptomyces sp. NPDC059567]|uniref:DUF397 domain-containing protein n=1 Tax=Streptomyces sp. NPDC059567 TaxID=3346867 RepID=UPI0036B4F722
MTTDWYKSSYSLNEDAACVEVAHSHGELTQVRDSKVDGGPVVRLSNTAWRRFLAHSKTETAG